MQSLRKLLFVFLFWSATFVHGSVAAVVELQSDVEFKTFVQDAKKDQKVLVVYTASWCSPCTALIGRAKLLSKNDGVLLVLLDVEALNGVAVERGIKTIPRVEAWVGGVFRNGMDGAIMDADLQKLF